MPDGPERTKILQRMSELVAVYAPWNLHAYRYENVLVQPWLAGLQVQRVQPASLAVLSTSTASGASRRASSAMRSSRARRGARGRARSSLRLPAAGAARSGPIRRRCCASCFRIAETGFDPQATSDYYSNYVKRAIFEPLYRFDYLARPHKVVPNTAAAMPEDLGGRPDVEDPDPAGHLLHRRSGVQGQEARAHRRRLRLFVQAPARPEDALADRCGSSTARSRAPTSVLAKAKEAGQVRLRRADRGLEGARPLHAAAQAQGAGLRARWPISRTSPMAAVAREVVEAYGDGVGWVMANPVGTGPFRLKEWRRGQKIVLEANPGFRDEFYPSRATIRRDRERRREDEGQDAAADRPRRDLRSSRSRNPQLLAFAQRRARLRRRARRLVPTCSSPATR